MAGSATIALLLFPLAPLDDASIGDSGWIVGGAMIVFAYGVALGLLRSGGSDQAGSSPSTMWPSA